MRKFATLAVGAMMAASAVAAVSMDSTQLTGYKFFNNGEPAVKVVIGARAQPQDVVVAANIAAMIGNLAYTDKDVTVVGKDGVSCGAGAGTCAVDAATKKVTLSVTVPGASPANVYTMKTYINDYLDNQVDTVRDASTGLYGGDTTFTYAQKVTPDKTSVLALPNSGKVDNPRNRDVKQTQNIYLGAYTHYETGTAYKTVIADKMRAAYTLAFSESLPLCWDTSKEGVLGCPSNDQLNSTHTKIKLLGQDWVVIAYTMTDATNVKSIDLGKETAYNPYMQVDDEATAANGAKVALKSVQVTSSVSQAAFQVTSPTGTVTIETLAAGQTKDVAGITIRVNNVFSGVSGFNYADVSIFSDRLTLTNNVLVDSTTHNYWYASIFSQNSSTSQAIANITLYSSYPYVKSDDKWVAGEKLSMIRGQESYDFTFQGLDDASVGYDNLGFNVQNGDIPFSASQKWTGKFVEINSGVSNAFQNGSLSKNIVRVALGALTANLDSIGAAPVGSAFIQDTTGFWKPMTETNATVGFPVASGLVKYYYSGSEQSGITVVGNSTFALLSVKEFDEDNMAGTAKYLTFLYDPALGTAGQFADAVSSTVTSKVGYSTAASLPTYETGFVTNRGVKFLSIGTTSASLQYPKVPVKAKYTLKTSGTNATAGSVSLTLGVGEAGTIDSGYVATVSSIAATTTGAAGTSGLTGLDAIAANPTKAAVVNELNTGTNPMVMLDSDSGAASASAVIVVGGPIVNTLAVGQPAKAGDSFVTVQGGKIFVYGWTAADTTAAGNELISWLATNRATIRG